MYYPYTGNQQIIQVTGEAGARALQMMPNCSALLLDKRHPLCGSPKPMEQGTRQ